MTEDLPSFDPDHETPAPKERPPKKPRRKPSKRTKRENKLVIVKAVSPKKKRRGRPASGKKEDRRTKAFRQQRTTEAIAAVKADPVEFLRRVCGFDVQPWQAFVIRAMMEDKL